MPQIAQLVALDEIWRITRSVYHTGALGVSRRAVGADVVHNTGIQGVGQRIAILDSGIRKGTLFVNLQHPAIQGIGAGLHANFTFEPNEFDEHPTMHGTGVAGIAASADPGSANPPRDGIARQLRS